MKTFIIKTLANAAALAVAVWLIPDIGLTGDDNADKAVTLLLVALIFGVVNFVVKPLVQLLSLPLLLLTLGLFTLVINALMLMLTSWIADEADLSFHVDGFWTAVLGGLVISIVSWATSMVLDRD
ncbi:phage holin family protein [Streptomyces synnematoformans]|uniref:Phage holin family protein n=1 Tax=Streptomyces synnematoformans TaxID=415721 RepID=A0ABN1ZJC5_9ACTN